MPIIGMFNSKNVVIFEELIKSLEQKGRSKLSRMGDLAKEGFHASPAGLSQLTFITGVHSKDRTQQAFLLLDEDGDQYLTVKIKGTDFEFQLSKSDTLPALRTLTSVRTFFISRIDYFIKNEPKELEKLLMLSKWKDPTKFNWDMVTKKREGKATFLALARRFRPDSLNTHFFAFYLDVPFICPHTFKILKLDQASSKYQCLFLNSICTLVDIVRYREQTTEGYTDIMQSDLQYFKMFNVEKLNPKDKVLLEGIFEKLHAVEFPSLVEQLKNRFWARIELDSAVLRTLGFSKGDINALLPSVYDAVVEELTAMQDMKSK